MVQISGIDSGRSDHRRAPLTLSDPLDMGCDIDVIDGWLQQAGPLPSHKTRTSLSR